MKIQLFKFDTIDSTNSEAMRQAHTGAAEGVCIVADEQTAGRGRFGRVWSSKKGAGLYFSIILRPKFEPRHFPLVTLMAGIAANSALKSVGVETDIKWVNDLIVRDRKICGILAEASESVHGRFIIIGIGINITNDNIPTDSENFATSIMAEGGKADDVDALVTSLCEELRRGYDLLSAEGGPKMVRDLWCSLSSYAVGKRVVVDTSGEIFSGTTCGVEENGALIVQTDDGTTRTVEAGEISRVRPG